MMFYKEIIQAKTSQKVPVFNSGRTAHSKYNPSQEGRDFARESDGAKFAVIAGIAGGYHIKAFMDRNPQCRILAVEHSEEDFLFLKKNIPCVKELSENKNFCAVTADTLKDEFIKNYIPQIDGSLAIAANRAWADEDKEFYQNISLKIKEALELISADVSTQAHFGSIWQKNIFSNLKTLSLMHSDPEYPAAKISPDTSKTAAIIAAGPSLDRTLCRIKAEREKYFVIAADTAYKSLVRQKIIPDAAVSIDAQSLSAAHFIGEKKPQTIFVLSLDSAPAAARSLYKNRNRIIFTSSGHPLAGLASAFCKRPFVRLNSGSGTVTVAAADFALKCGFTKIQVFGADFAFCSGKPYTKGTYLDDLYRKSENRLQNAESAFSALMFRTELRHSVNENIPVAETALLSSYRKTFGEWLLKNSLVFEYRNFIWDCARAGNSTAQKPEVFESTDFDAQAFKAVLEDRIKTALQKPVPRKEDELAMAAAPYMAFLEKRYGESLSTADKFLLALKRILLYNKNL